MNQAHFHLVVNHFPIIAPIIGFLVLIGAFLFRSEIIKRTAYLILIFGALVTVVAFSSGEEAEDVIENLPGVEEKFIEIHEESAEVFAILSYTLGGLALVGFWASWKEKSFSNFLAIAIILFGIVVLFFATETGTSGGEIRHVEIRGDFQPE